MTPEELNLLKIQYKDKRINSYEELSDYINHDKLTCLICGEKFEDLSHHVFYSHHMFAREYRLIFNIPMRTALLGIQKKSQLSEIRRARPKSNNSASPDKPKQPNPSGYKTAQRCDYSNQKISQIVSKRHAARRASLRDQVVSVLDRMERTKESLVSICEEAGMLSYNTVHGVVKRDPELLARFEDILKSKSTRIEIKTGLELDELIPLVDKFYFEGHSFSRISKSLKLAATTVIQMIRRQGAYREFPKSQLE